MRNTLAQPVTVIFSTSQRFDLAVEFEHVRLDVWSRGRTFAQVVGELRWGPGETLFFSDQWLPRTLLAPGTVGAATSQPLAPGVYRIFAELTTPGVRPVSRPEVLTIGLPLDVPQGCSTLQPPVATDMPVAALARTVEPAGVLHSLWQRQVTTGDYAGFAPEPWMPSDLATINRRFPVTICVTAPARIIVP